MADPFVANVTAESTVEVTYRSLDYLLAHQRRGNPKDHDLGEIIQSIARHGFVGYVTFDPSDEVMVAGHGRLQALAAMRADGYDPPYRIVEPFDEKGESHDWQVPTYDKVFANDHEREAYTVGDNQTTILGGWDNDALIDALKNLHEHDPDEGMKGTGFDAEDLQAMLEARDFVPPPPAAPAQLMTRYGVSINVQNRDQENRIAELLADHGWTGVTRFSEA